ncbi:hypothetical protein [Mesorhizobium sp. KR2-14]|uniref:hypothetical protein n=1 Tax=Mesorhizobium sp. KR2-14 TaxID=3156610 RepID=UPI0032B5DB90
MSVIFFRPFSSCTWGISVAHDEILHDSLTAGLSRQSPHFRAQAVVGRDEGVDLVVLESWPQALAN